jgi:ribonuclease J
MTDNNNEPKVPGTAPVAPAQPSQRSPRRAFHARPQRGGPRTPRPAGPGFPQGPSQPANGSGEAAHAPLQDSDGKPVRKPRSRNKFNSRRPRLATERRLPPTSMHEGKIGAPEDSGSDDDTLKVIALGGLGEIGKNMYMLEYKDEILLIDAGIMFPDENMPGIDFIIPNTKYLEDKLERIQGLILTHGHMDHVGAVQYLQDKIGNPEIYAAMLTRRLVEKRQHEFPHLPKLSFTVVKDGDIEQIGKYFKVEFFHMNHNIPDDLGVFITTPVGNFIHTADFKFDATPLSDQPVNLDKLKEFGDRGVLALMCDSTDAEKTGHSISEQTIFENMEIIFKEATGMIVVGTFSSMINRMQQLVQLSEKYGRKVIFDGLSLKTNVEIAKEMGYIKISNGTEITMDQVDDYPRERITVIATGAMGQESASLMRIVNREHRHIEARKGDTVIFSSSVIPGNERSVQYLKDMLYRGGIRVYHYQMMDIHAGGHARQEDIKEILALTRPKFLMPHHGQYSMMVTLGKVGQSMGIPEENVIIADNGQIIHMTPDQWWFDKKTAPSNYVMVDGLGIGDIGNVVLRDRQVLAEDGMFVVIILVEARTGQVRGSPDIISRGFIYLKENKELLGYVRKRIKHIVEGEKQRPLNIAYLKDEIREDIGKFLFQKTERRPMILPVVIEV